MRAARGIFLELANSPCPLLPPVWPLLRVFVPPCGQYFIIQAAADQSSTRDGTVCVSNYTGTVFNSFVFLFFQETDHQIFAYVALRL